MYLFEKEGELHLGEVVEKTPTKPNFWVFVAVFMESGIFYQLLARFRDNSGSSDYIQYFD